MAAFKIAKCTAEVTQTKKRGQRSRSPHQKSKLPNRMRRYYKSRRVDKMINIVSQSSFGCSGGSISLLFGWQMWGLIFYRLYVILLLYFELDIYLLSYRSQALESSPVLYPPCWEGYALLTSRIEFGCLWAIALQNCREIYDPHFECCSYNEI